jgi:protein SCO1/2
VNVKLPLVFLLLLTGCTHPANKLPKYAHVPSFTMTDANGQTFHSSELAGKVWVADFIYTNCPAECPMMTAKMKKLSLQTNPAVELVSFSVDPDHDTPAALKTFASHYGAPTPHWTFLTGTADTVHLLAYTTFHVGDIIGKMEHSTKFALVDQQGYIRGYYSSLDEEGIPALLKDTEALRQN